MNAHVRDQLNALKTPAGWYQIVNEAADYTITSTSFVDIDATDLSATITTGGGDVLAFFTGCFTNAGGNIKNYFDIHESVANARLGGDDGMVIVSNQTSTLVASVTLCGRFTSLSAAAHTFKVQAKVASSTLTIYAGAATATLDVHPVFWGFEI